MLKKTNDETALVLCLLAGCTTMVGSRSAKAPVDSESSVVWVQNPRAYVEDIASSSESDRRRLRDQALADFLKAPGSAQQVHVNLVFDATVQSLADGYSAADALAHALGAPSGLTAESRAVLTAILLRTEKRIDDLRGLASRDNELAALRDSNRALEQGKAASDAQQAGLQRALREAQAKLEALKSIEQTLEGNTPKPSNGSEPNQDRNQ
jgi:hypothetical protein